MQRLLAGLVSLCGVLVAIPVTLAQAARGPTVGSVEIVRDGDAVRATLTIGWPNAWRNARNHDAAWVVLRGPDARRAPLRLAATGHTAEGDVPAAFVATDDWLGVFVAPAADHRGDVSWQLSLALEPGEAELTQPITAWAVGMVFIPGGGFDLGDDDPLGVRFGAFHRVGEDGKPAGTLRVEDEAEIRVAREAGALWYETNRERYRGDQQGPIPAAWPKGTQPFYLMAAARSGTPRRTPASRARRPRPAASSWSRIGSWRAPRSGRATSSPGTTPARCSTGSRCGR